jgi:hypothetical protein
VTELTVDVRQLHEHAKDSFTVLHNSRRKIEAATATVKEQASQIQKVSAQLELSKSAPQTVLNNQ